MAINGVSKRLLPAQWVRDSALASECYSGATSNIVGADFDFALLVDCNVAVENPGIGPHNGDAEAAATGRCTPEPSTLVTL